MNFTSIITITVLFCTVWYFIVLYRPVLYCTVLYFTYFPVLYCMVMYCIVPSCTVLFYSVLYILSCTVLYNKRYWCCIVNQNILRMRQINWENERLIYVEINVIQPFVWWYYKYIIHFLQYFLNFILKGLKNLSSWRKSRETKWV